MLGVTRPTSISSSTDVLVEKRFQNQILQKSLKKNRGEVLACATCAITLVKSCSRGVSGRLGTLVKVIGEVWLALLRSY